MKFFLESRILSVSALGLALALAPAARAQNVMGAGGNGVLDPAGNGAILGAVNGVPGGNGVLDPATVAPASVVSVGTDNLADVPALLPRAGAVSLVAYAADLNDNPAARDALLDYVRRGGTVFLHTDAARLFGYNTVAAREGTAKVAGQLYGRARAAVPFGTVPLLWDDGESGLVGPARAPGINTVFYTLRAGDDLVVSHPAGTPLLRVTDLASPTRAPLYAAAIAPFGAGWAIFTPNTIDQRRADGAAFARNLLKFIGGSRYVGVSQAAIVSGQGLLAELDRALQNGPDAALPAFGTANGNGAMGAGAMGAGAMGAGAMGGNDDLPVAREGTMTGTPTVRNGADAPRNGNAAPLIRNGADIPRDGNAVPLIRNGADIARAGANNAAGGAAAGGPGPVLLLTRGEVTAFGAALQNDPQNRGAVALAILRARVALLNGDGQAAERQLVIAERLAPGAGEIPFLRGASALANIGGNVVSGQRALGANLAANSFAAASRANPAFYTPLNGGVEGPLDAGVFYGDIAGTQLGALGAQVNLFSQVLALEPPLSRVVGNGASAVTIRYFEGDSSVPFIEAALKALTSSNLFGWSVDGQEVLLFPTPAIYERYRAAAGLNQQNVPLPAAALGDVVDGRILMVSIPASRPATIGPNGVPRVLPLRATSANVLARFEAYALLDAYIGAGDGRVPAWMTLGLSSLADLTVNGDGDSVRFDQELRRYAATDNLLTPEQFYPQLGQSSLLAQAEATALMRYFYAQFGAGSVAETIQRIGAGQTVDEALLATTGVSEADFFRSWGNVQFGALTPAI